MGMLARKRNRRARNCDGCGVSHLLVVAGRPPGGRGKKKNDVFLPVMRVHRGQESGQSLPSIFPVSWGFCLSALKQQPAIHQEWGDLFSATGYTCLGEAAGAARPRPCQRNRRHSRSVRPAQLPPFTEWTLFLGGGGWEGERDKPGWLWPFCQRTTAAVLRRASAAVAAPATE